jgi:hypothetical protein
MLYNTFFLFKCILFSGEQPEKPPIDDNDYEALDAETMKQRKWDEFTEANPRGAGKYD